MPLQDLSVGSTSGLGSRQSEPTPERTSWWDSFTSAFTGSGGDDSNMTNPDDPSSSLPVVDFGDDDDSADIYDEPEFTYEPEVYAAITDASTAGVFYTPDDIIQEAYEGDMAGKGEDKPDPLGNMGVPPITLEDVTGTDAGALSNPDPLYKLADDIANPTITTTPLDQEAALKKALMEGQPSGLMSRPSSFTGEGVQVAQANIPNWMTDMSASELTDVLVGIREGTHDPETGERIEDVPPAAEADPETGQKIKSADDVLSDMASQGLMSSLLDGKDGTIATKQYTLSKTDLEEQAKAMFPNNPTAMGAFIATVNAESAGGKDMVENGYSKVKAIQKFVLPYKKKDGTLGPKMKARKKAIEESESPEEIFEIVYGSGYTGNTNLGNTEVGDGFRFIGRGPIQLTGRANYEKYGNRVGVDLVNNPELMATDQKVSLAVTREYLKDKGLDKVKTASDLWKVIGHAGGTTEANKRWKEAQKIANRFRRSTSPRPMLRPTN